MKQPTSLTLRLTLLFCTVATIGYLSFGWILEQSIEQHFESGDLTELRLIAHAVEQPLLSVQEHDLGQLKQRFNDMLIGHHNPLLRITDASGNLLYNSPELDLSKVSVPLSLPKEGKVELWRDNGHNYRLLILQLAGKNNSSYTVITAIATDFHYQFIAKIHLTLWLMIGLGIIIMAIMSWLAVRYGHRPLHQIIDEISHISSNELNTRLDPDSVPSELSELAISFNDLLQRLDIAFSRLSNFSDDIAHELRTPVTNLMTQTQVVVSRTRTVEEYQEILYSNIEEFEYLSQMIADMLFLAKTDNMDFSFDREDIKIHDEIINLFDYYGAWAEENFVSLILEGKAQLHCNRLMLRRALSNLLSNAIRYTPPNKGVTIKLETRDNQVVILIENPGDPILSKHIPKLFDRFYRADPSRQRTSDDGAGLGLAITKSIIEAHGGNVIVSSDETRTQFQIILPLRKQDAKKY